MLENVKGRVGTRQKTIEIEEEADVKGRTKSVRARKKYETIRKWQLIMHKE